MSYSKQDKKSWKDSTGLRDEMEKIKMIKETQDHDRKTCICEVCKMYAIIGTIYQNGRLYKVEEGDWKILDRDEYLHAFIRVLQYRIDKKAPKEKLIEYVINEGKKRGQTISKEMAEKVAIQLLEPLHTIMFKGSPMGMLREI